MPALMHCRIISRIRGLPRDTHSMKHPIEKPADQIMRFFTPELYLQFNSSDESVANRADEEWERAVNEYKLHLETLRDGMPSQVRKISELCLHDAEVLGMDFQSFSPLPQALWPVPFWSALAILSLKQDNTVQSLIYTLWDRVREYPGPKDWPFAKSPKLWLYDEIDPAKDGRGMFLHRALFSDGSIVEVPFVSAIVSVVRLPVADKSGEKRRIA